MKDGVIQQVDTPQNLYDKPQNKFVAGFIGSPQMNFMDATVSVKGDVAYVTAAGKEIALTAEKSKKIIAGGYDGKTVTIGIRPENVGVEVNAVEGAFDADVNVYELLGAEVYLYLVINGEAVTARVSSATSARVGDKVSAVFDVNKIHVFDKETEQIITN
jgi:multiple sugar transport system ATP-binding protein